MTSHLPIAFETSQTNCRIMQQLRSLTIVVPMQYPKSQLVMMSITNPVPKLVSTDAASRP
ncbi:MAG: hypothetical protein EZS28_011524, partial [Streblomastix strix]